MPSAQSPSAEGWFHIEVAGKWLSLHLPCLKLVHSMAMRSSYTGRDKIVGAIVRVRIGRAPAHLASPEGGGVGWWWGAPGGSVLWGLPERNRNTNHFIAYRLVCDAGSWEFVDSIGGAQAATEDVALEPSGNKYFLVHKCRGPCELLPNIGADRSEA